MTSREIRQAFFDFFKSKDHKIVPSAPIVNKDDPSLMFTNAGMNQFKDYFLGNQEPSHNRIADTQKCLRVSGKHNDLEEVGRDSYHHTMFEMLGNWSFGDYFKEEAIEWAWELLVDVYGLDPERLYATIFEGDDSDNLEKDQEAADYWRKYLPDERILFFDRKDNFWEMGETGPCGPCSEIHIDLRTEKERNELMGGELVNKEHPLVIEIWNLVFIQFNRKADGSLNELPAKHVDTGMGFERLTMAMQGKLANYDTDIFMPFIHFIEKETGIKYQNQYEPELLTDIAMRVAVDHCRAVAFSIADGQLPSNTGAGYVIRRILRRSVRYNYSYLNQESPFLFNLIPLLADYFTDVFPELKSQQSFIQQVIEEEEKSFLHTLAAGLKRFETLQLSEDNRLSGEDIFELYDTYGFPFDLTRLLAAEKNYLLDEAGFKQALDEQRQRSKADAKKVLSDWTVVAADQEVVFEGYDHLHIENSQVIKYRIVQSKGITNYQIVLSKTPFYAEGGGQVGDTGVLTFGEEETVQVINTIKENDLIIHLTSSLPSNLNAPVTATVDATKRLLTTNNHTATHLLHAALKQVLGNHVHQKGSLVNQEHLRFDFSHFKKVEQAELTKIEEIVNKKIRENIPLDEKRSIPIEEAKAAGATMMFGEKYGDHVRMITYDPAYSRELCGGCHVDQTGQIGLFKITQETSVAAGVRRIEAVTAAVSEKIIRHQLEDYKTIKHLLKAPDNAASNVEALLQENKELKHKIEKLQLAKAGSLKDDLLATVQKIDGMSFIGEVVALNDSKALKTLIFQLESALTKGIVVLGNATEGKAQIMVKVNQELIEVKGLHAGNLVKAAAKHIQGGGGGQPFFASAGGSNPEGLTSAIQAIRNELN